MISSVKLTAIIIVVNIYLLSDLCLCPYPIDANDLKNTIKCLIYYKRLHFMINGVNIRTYNFFLRFPWFLL